MSTLSDSSKLLLLVSLLSKDRIISNNAKCFLKELILRRDPRLKPLIERFETKEANDMTFLEQIHNLIADEAQILYNDLFIDTSLEVGKTLSKSERENKNLSDEKSLIYGEVEFESFYRVLRKINPSPGSIFYDLGSGTGKAVFVARFTQDFAKCIGVEILESLHEQAQVIVDRYNKSFKSFLAIGQSQYANVYEGSLLDFDWSDGDVVFANSTCFSEELMQQLSVRAENLQPGAIVVTFTKGLTSTAFELLERKRYRMSWGPATVFIHRRLKADGKPVGPSRLNLLPSDARTYDDDYYPDNNVPTQPTLSNDYDVDIDYNEEEDEEEEEEEEDDEDDDENNDDEEEEEEEEEDEIGDEGDDENDDEDDDTSEDIYHSKVYDAAVVKNSPVKSSPGRNDTYNLTRSPLSASKAPEATTKVTPVKSSPSSAGRPAFASPSVSESLANEFNMLNSPQDTALLMRKKRASQQQHYHQQHYGETSD